MKRAWTYEQASIESLRQQEAADRHGARARKLQAKITKLAAQLETLQEKKVKAEADARVHQCYADNAMSRCADCSRYFFGRDGLNLLSSEISGGRWCVLDASTGEACSPARHRCDVCQDKARSSSNPDVRATALNPAWAK